MSEGTLNIATGDLQRRVSVPREREMVMISRRLQFGHSWRNYRSLATLVCSVALTLNAGIAIAAPKLKFDWPVPSRVTVTESALKKGKTAKMRYDIVLDKQKEGKNLEVKFDKFELLEVSGVDLTAPESRAALGPVLAQITAMQGAMPTLIIDQEGTVVDVAGMEELVSKALGLLPEGDPKLRESIGTMMRSPEVIEQIKQKTKDFWRVWVQSWLDCSLAPGQEETVDTHVPFLSNKVITVPLKIRNDGPAADSPGNIKLSAQTILQGEEATKAFADMMAKLTAAIPVKEGVKPFTPDMVKEMKRTTTFTVVTNPKTLQPQTANSEIVTEIAIGEGRRSDTEKHDYTFVWPGSAPEASSPAASDNPAAK